jgi:hypothetical protein
MVKEVQAGLHRHDHEEGRDGRLHVIGKERMSALIETMEILADPAAMKAIRDYEAGKLKVVPKSRTYLSDHGGRDQGGAAA